MRPKVGLLILLVALGGCRAARAPIETEAGRLGRVKVFRGVDAPHGFVFLFSDRAGWNEALERAAGQIASLGAVVVGVDLAEYLRRLAASDDGCHYLISEIEDMSERLQRDFGFEGYRSPILAGIGAGGTLAFAALAQSPAATIDGAVSIDPAPELHTKVALCPGAPSTPAPEGGFRYAATASLPGWWVASTQAPLPPDLAALATPAAGGAGASPEERLVAILAARLALPTTPSAERALADLPLVEVPASGDDGKLMAVIYSGDGGWRDLDKQIAGVLAHEGMPVVGVDALRYFWRAKSPDRVAADLSLILRHYRERWGDRRVVLVGYSFGAGILPFAFNRLPKADRDRIVEMSLLGFGPTAPFQIEPQAWFGAAPGADALPVLPEIARIDLSSVQCFYGEEEEDTVCPSEELRGAEVIRTRGSHHFDGDYGALARRILDGARRRAAQRGS